VTSLLSQKPKMLHEEEHIGEPGALREPRKK
jgi:hypothetical protein